MKVAIYHNLPPGGALRVVREFVRRAGPSVSCDVFTLDFGELDDFAYADRGECWPTAGKDVGRLVRQPVSAGRLGTVAGGHLRRAALLRAVRAAERHVAAQIDGGAYDVALVHPCWFTQSPSVLSDLRTVPSVYYMHEVRRRSFEPQYADHRMPRNPRWMPGWAVERGVEAVLRARDKRAVASADAVLCNSRYTAAAAENAYGRRPNVAYLGIDDVTFNPETGDAGRRNRVLSVGGLEAFKGHHLAVEAISQLPGAIRPELHLVYQRCDEVYRDELLDLARSLGVKIVEHRDITDAALAGLYATSRATVLAAALEPFGLVALESSACGTPVVAVRQGGYLETVVDGENGLLVDRTPEAIVDGLRRVLEGELDRSPLEIRQTVLSSWHWDEAVARQVSFLASVAGKPQP